MAPARMSNKRKRISDRPAAKRQKTYKEDSSEPSSPRRLAASQESVDTATFYAARAILDENKTKYRIDWEPNPRTGEVYEPTWEPKGFVTKDLVEEWKKLKKQTPKPGKRNQGTRARTSSRSSSVARSNLSTPAEPRESRGRAPRRVIDSSPELPRTRTKVPTESPLFKPQDAPESTAEPSPAPAPLNQEHKVEISQPTDFDPDDYSKYSSSAIRASSPHSSQFITPKPTQTVSGSNVTSVFTPHAPTSLSARVIPDTLEVPGSSSFVLSSQQDSASKANGTSQVVPVSSTNTEENPLRSTIEEISAFESSARAPDSDPEPSSPALPDKVVDCVPESPSQTASSVSSPPPPETPDKSQSQSQSRSEHVATQQSQRSHQEPNGGAGSAGTREAEAQVQPNPREGHQEVRSLKAQGLARGEDAKASGTGSALKESAAELRTEAADSPATTTNSPTQERQPTNEEQEQATGPAAPADRERPGTDELNGARADPVTGSLGEGFGQEGGSSSILKEKDPNPVRERSVNPLEKPIQEHPFSSSPLPPAPSQGLDLFASNPPPLVETPSEMATPTKTRSGETPGSTSSSSGFRESLKQMRTTVRARHAAIARAEVESSPKVQTTSAAAVAQDITSSESATRSPSVVPSTNNATRSEIPAAPEHEEPDRLHTLEEAAAEPVPAPPIIVEPEEPGQPEVSSNRVILDEPPLGPMEYIIPLPLEGPQGDQYRRTITYYKDLIENSARSGWNGEDPPTKDVKHFVTRIHNVATHVDLENQDALTQQGIRPENQAEWDQSCSVKFRFLGRLLDLLCQQDLHIVIFARQGRVLDLAETFLKGKHISHYRPDKMGMSEVNGAPGMLSVTLLPTKGEGSTVKVRPASLLIALDHTLDSSSASVQSLRSHHLDGRLSPVVSLVVVNTAEHIKRCLSPNVKGLDRLRTAVSCIAQLRLEAGKLPDDYPRPFTAAEEVARYVAEHEAEWPLPAIGGFKDLVEFDEPLPQFSVPSSVPAGTQEISGAQKRPMVFEDSEPTKKMRMTSQAPDFINPNDLTRISDSIAAGPSPSQPSQAAQNSSVIAQPPSYPHAEAATSTDSSDLDVENDVSTLRALVISNRNRCSDLETELAALQYRFETLRTEHGALKRGRDDAVLALAAANAKNGTQAAAIVALKAERVELMQKLEEARKLLEGSSVPEIAQLAALENSKQAAEERAAKWERKFAALEKERDFFSSTYQTASQAASELRTQNNDLEKSVTDLAKRASGEAARLKQLGADQRAKKYEKEVARLKLMVRNLEELVRKKDEDLRAMKGRSGYGTRQSSVPRSPSVRPSRGSRANSPLAGGLGSRLGALRADR
ncbi:hypothetical protein H2201_007345 [Coniosporium apollinis]|uniref:Chromo domain-containing protein n=1 Tax=Coniosporium apollinis TaxID=61459 RepID=A0ABQ9NJL4_9PEZI|nr:hypothetical protein H2201_007345 [Coniosporium apollinis]